jgi:S-methylmethionine-dependent homocysteine/selenocysteine methylase
LSATADLLGGDALVLADGGIETRLMFDHGLELPPHIQTAGLVGHPALREVYASYVAAAREHGLPVIIGTPTFRAGARYAEAAGADVVELNAAAVRHQMAIRDAAGDGPPILIAGVLGPYGDAYTPSEAPDAETAERYHAIQAGALAGAGVDLLFAPTFPAVEEGLGAVRAMTATGRPAIISWVLGRDGRVLDGTPLAEAVARVDAAAQTPPIFHSLSCIHPTVAALALDGVAPGRVLECKANGSPLTPAELVALDHLEGDAPEPFAAAMWRLHLDHGLRVLGGCCGTDDRHMRALGALMAAGDGGSAR